VLKTLYPTLFSTASRSDTTSGKVPTEMTVRFEVSGIGRVGSAAITKGVGAGKCKSYRLVSRNVPRLTGRLD
jgi:hypothetical protein